MRHSADRGLAAVRARREIRSAAALLVLAAVLVGGCAVARRPHPLPSPPTELVYAEHLLTAERIEVEIDWVAGCRPTPGTVDGIRAFLERYAAPHVDVILDEELPYDTDDRSFGAHRRPARRDGVASVYLLFVPRLAAVELRDRRGVAFPASGVAVIAHDRVQEAAFLTVRSDEVERFVVQHELGHLLGLVSDARHDADGHCTDPRCIMYAGVDLRALLANAWRVFTGRLPSSLDDGCLRELVERRAQALARRSRCASETDTSPTMDCATPTATSPRSENATPPPDSAT